MAQGFKVILIVRVLHVLDHSLPIHSGYAFRTAEILAWQQSRGWDVAALTGPKHDPAEEVGAPSGNIEYLRARYTARQSQLPGPLRQVAVVTRLRRRILELCTTRSFDLLHAHSPSLNGLAAISAAASLDLPVIYEMRASWEDAAVDHGTTTEDSLRYRMMRATETWTLRRAAAVTTICEGLKREIVSRSVPESRITVIPNGVDVRRFTPLAEDRESLRQRFDVAGRFVLVFCGSFYSYEGLDILFEAINLIGGRKSEFRVLLAGGGEQDATLRQTVEEKGLGSVVRFLGRVPQSVVIELYNLAHACVFPRHRMKLTEMVTPLKPLEAMACESVVLASDVGGHRELIRDGETGHLFRAGDPQSLAESLLALKASEPDDAARIRKAARRYVAQERTWDVSAGRYDSVYRRVMRP